jgi:alkylation response protein AidB-like acyl-CoA dehydrogenase
LSRLGIDDTTNPQDIALRRRWEDHICRAGWSGLGWPREHGGRALSLARQAMVLEILATLEAPLPLNALGHGILGPTLLLHGTPWQKARFLPPLLRNEEVWCQGYSEPGAGSDLAALATRAVRDGDHYRVTGHKIWTSFANHADWCFLLVRTDPDLPKHRGIAFLLVDLKSPGVRVRPIRQITGENDYNEVFFDAVRVPVSQRVGAESEGWSIAMAAAGFERGTYFLPRVVRMRVELRRLMRLAATRRIGATPCLDDPVIRDRLARLVVDIRVLGLHAERMLATAASGAAPGVEGSVIKLLWSETHQRLMELALDILGPDVQFGPQEAAGPDRGRWQRDFLWTRAETIFAGTSEIQRNIIAERGLGLPR